MKLTPKFKKDRQGDKENSPYFEEYLKKIYDRREKSGLANLLGRIKAVLIQIQTGEATKYLMELYLMTPYRFEAGYKSKTHRVYILKNKEPHPRIVVLEPISKNYTDEFSYLNHLYPRAAEKTNVKYLGEIYYTESFKETRQILDKEEVRFWDRPKNSFLANPNFLFTQISYFTNNIVGYTESGFQTYGPLKLGSSFSLTRTQQSQLNKADTVHRKFDLDKLVYGLDHLATRVLCGEREHAILEFLSLTDYYFWGAFDIPDMNSSTNICRKPGLKRENCSPAKVFTANDIPFYVNSIDYKPSPTEDFVRNFGRRMHHMAYEVIDGETMGLKNIDYVVDKLMSEDVPFLAQIIGECKDFPDLKQIFSKSSKYSFLITEYVQRCHDFQGFFTKSNVAYLTKAAGEDEKLKQAGVYD